MLRGFISVRAGCVAALACAMTGTISAGVQAEEGICPNEALRQELHSGQLPDCRAFELVSPDFKDASVPEIEAVSGDGLHVVVKALGAFASTESEPTNGLGGAVYEFSRTGSGWVTSPLTPPASRFPALFFLGASRDLTKTLWMLREPSQSTAEGDLYVREADGHFVKIGRLNPFLEAGSPAGSNFRLVEGPAGPFVRWEGASTDLSHVLLSYNPVRGGAAVLWPGDTTIASAFASLYEYVGTGNIRPELVGVDDEGKLISNCGIELGGAEEMGREGDKYNAVSADGTSVFFTARHEAGAGGVCSPAGIDNRGPEVNELYVRIDRSETVGISEPSEFQCEECRTGHSKVPTVEEPAEFQGASEDGTKAFFTTTQELLPGDAGENLYEFDFDRLPGQQIVLVSKGSLEPSAVQNVAAVSEDGSHVYFIAGNVLASNENSNKEKPVKGDSNLYVFERDEAYPSGRVTFITTSGPSRAQTTPNGRFLVFQSGSQVFEYDAKEELLVNVSDGHTAEISRGTGINVHGRSAYPTWQVESDANISSDGAYVIFTENGNPVFEYHSVGPISNGKVSVISDRALSGVAEPASIDASGDSVLFRSAEPLLASDTNTGADIYDARVNGGFPEPATPAGCDGEACQGARSLIPVFGSAGSSAASGGNLVPPVESKPPAVEMKPVQKSLTRAQKLTDALKACKKKPKRERAACEALARKRYGAKSKAAKSGGRVSGQVNGR
jgi:hypothetical protein